MWVGRNIRISHFLHRNEYTNLINKLNDVCGWNAFIFTSPCNTNHWTQLSLNLWYEIFMNAFKNILVFPRSRTVTHKNQFNFPTDFPIVNVIFIATYAESCLFFMFAEVFQYRIQWNVLKPSQMWCVQYGIKCLYS